MKKIVNFRPLLFIFLAVCFGIIISYLICFNKTAWLLAVLFIVTALLVAYIIYSIKNNILKSSLKFIAILVLSFIIAFLSLWQVITDYQDDKIGGFTYTTVARVIEINDEESYSSIVLDDISVDGVYSGKLKHKAIAYVYGSNTIKVGDIITFTTRISQMNAEYEGRFSSWHVSTSVKYSLSLSTDEIRVIDNSTTLFERINLKIKDQLKSNLDTEEFSVAYALLCGNSDYVDARLLDNYRSAGVAHVFAVSGLHIGFLALMLSFALKKVKINKIVKVLLIIFVLIIYSGICGFSASSVRATIMCAVALFAKSLGEKYDGLSALSLAGIIVLLISPVQLFCVGFQLSFGVVASIILFAKPISNKLTFMPKKLAVSLASVISAQIVSVPICLYAFQQFSLIGVLANLIFIPIVGVAYIFLFISTLLSLITTLGFVFLFLPNYLLKAINFIFGVCDLSVFMVGGFSFGAFGLVYFIWLITTSPIINLKRISKIITTVCMLICVGVGVTVYNVKDSKTSYVYVTSTPSMSAVLIDDTDKNVVVVPCANYIVSTSKIERAVNQSRSGKIDYLILPNNDNGVDVQQIMSTLLRVCKVDKVYFMQNLTMEEQSVLAKNFSKSTFYKIEQDGELKLGGLQLNFRLDGHLVSVRIKNKSLAILSYLGEKGSLVKSSELGFHNTIIANDYAEQISNLYPKSEIITYKETKKFINATSNGNYKIKFN